MISAVIKYEYRTQWRGMRMHAYLGVLVCYILLGCLLLIVMHYRGSPLSIDEGITDRRALTMVACIETALVLGLSPLLTLSSIVSEDTGYHQLPMLSSPMRSVDIVLGKLSLPLFLLVAAILASALPMLLFAVMSKHVSLTTILTTRSLLLTFGLGGIVVGLCGSALSNDVYTAAGIVYLIIGCIGGSAILAGPLIAHLTNATALIHLVVWSNPFIGMAAALDFDLLRTEWLYVLSPLGQRRVVYPTWNGVGLAYLFVATLLLAVSVWRIGSLRRNIDRWPLSSRS